MQKKFISMIALFTFLHSLFAGCVKTTTVPRTELDEEAAKCCVQEVVLTTGEKYELKDPGGQYKVVSRLITGTLNDGRKFFLDLTNEKIKEIRISTEQTISRVELARNPDQTIYEIMVDDKIYTFDQNGGRVESEIETIHGTTTTGVEIDVPIEDVLSVKLKVYDPKKTGMAAGIGVFGAVLVFIGVVIVLLATGVIGPKF